MPTTRERRLIGLVVALCASVLLNGCQGDTANETTAAPEVRNVIMTTFYPTTWMAEQIGDGVVGVECPLPADADPIFWTPPDDVVAQYQSAALVVTNGAGFEKWVTHTSLPASRLVDTTVGLSEPFIEYENVVVHQHGPGGEHAHEGTDGHTWLDPAIAKHQAGRIATAASRAWPKHASTISKNLGEIERQLDELDQELRELSPKLQSVRLFASHPAYNYLARRYEWNITNLDLDPRTELTEEQLLAVTGQDSEKPTVLLWESKPLAASVDRLNEAGVKSLVFSPGEQKPESGDYLMLMRENIAQLRSVLK